VWQNKMHTSEPLVPDFSSGEGESASEKLKKVPIVKYLSNFGRNNPRRSKTCFQDPYTYSFAANHATERLHNVQYMQP